MCEGGYCLGRQEYGARSFSAEEGGSWRFRGSRLRPFGESGLKLHSLRSLTLSDLFKDDRPDFLAGETALMRLPRRAGFVLMLRCRGLEGCLNRLFLRDRFHDVLGRSRHRAEPNLFIVDEAERSAKRRMHRVVPRGDQTSKMRKAGSALNLELQRAGRTCRLDE